ncbi:MAG: CDGSH iron-sulfur domain-containing protein [Planctomycetota bacterium]
MADAMKDRKLPVTLFLEPGNYLWCACGRSKIQPLCDGSHEETDFQPVPFTVVEKKKLVLCNCKQTLNPPFCDGAHLDLQ